MTNATWSYTEGERAFGRAARARLFTSLFRRRAELLVHDGRTSLRRPTARVKEIPLEAITGTLEPGRAREFDRAFRPAKRTRKRWLRVWVGEHTPAGLPPIDVVRIGDSYAIRDGHHRVSVAHARGAATIDAVVA